MAQVTWTGCDTKETVLRWCSKAFQGKVELRWSHDCWQKSLEFGDGESWWVQGVASILGVCKFECLVENYGLFMKSVSFGSIKKSSKTLKFAMLILGSKDQRDKTEGEFRVLATLFKCVCVCIPGPSFVPQKKRTMDFRTWFLKTSAIWRQSSNEHFLDFRSLFPLPPSNIAIQQPFGSSDARWCLMHLCPSHRGLPCSCTG